MITHKDWTWKPRFKQFVLSSENILIRNQQVGMWYAYLNLRMTIEGEPKQKGQIQSIQYVFPNTEFIFQYNDFIMKFLPDFEVKYVGAFLPEYHTLATIQGGKGRMYKHLLHKYPYLRLRVIEPIEIKTIVYNLCKAGIDLKKQITREI